MPGLILAVVLAFLGQSQLELGKKLLQAEAWDQALEAFQLAVQTHPDDAEAHYYLAQLYAYRGQEKETILHFREALRLRPAEPIIWSEYGNWLLSQRYLDEAEQVFRGLLKIRPEDPDAWQRLGLALYENGGPEDALPAYQRAIELAPTGQNYYLAGVACRSMDKLELARDFFSRGMAIEPDHGGLNLQLAEMLLQEGNLEQTLPHLGKLGPDDPAANYLRGVVHLRKRELQAAEAALLKVVAQDPQHTRANYQLGLLYARLNNEQLSQHYFELFRRLEAQDRERSRVTEKKTIVERPDPPNDPRPN